jgi:hypothetical protein
MIFLGIKQVMDLFYTRKVFSIFIYSIPSNSGLRTIFCGSTGASLQDYGPFYNGFNPNPDCGLIPIKHMGSYVTLYSRKGTRESRSSA